MNDDIFKEAVLFLFVYSDGVDNESTGRSINLFCNFNTHCSFPLIIANFHNCKHGICFSLQTLLFILLCFNVCMYMCTGFWLECIQNKWKTIRTDNPLKIFTFQAKTFLISCIPWSPKIDVNLIRLK